MSQYGRSTLDTKDAPASSRVYFPLRQDHILAAVVIRLFGTVTHTGGTVYTAAADGAFRYLRSIQVQADGQTLVSTSGPDLRLQTRFWMPEQPEGTNPTGAASESFEAYAILPFHMPHSKDPDSFALPAPFASRPTLLIDTGTGKDMAQSTDKTVAVSNVRIEVTEIPLFGTPFDGDAYDLVMVHQYVTDVATSQDDLKITLGNTPESAEIRAVLIRAEAGGTNGANFAPSDALVTSARLNIDGGNVIEKTSAPVLRQLNKVAYGLPATEPGALLLDSAEDRITDAGELWAAGGASKPVLALDVQKQTGDNRITVTVVSALRA